MSNFFYEKKMACFVLFIQRKIVCLFILYDGAEMKKTKLKNQKNVDGRKKMVLKFRDIEEDGVYDPNMKKRKNNGKRKHRQQTLKGMFYSNESDDDLMF